MDSAHFCGDILYFSQQSVEPVFYDIFRHLIFHYCGRRTGAFRIDKRKSAVIADFPYYIECLPEVFFCFSREAYNDVRGQRNVRYSFFDTADQLEISFLCISPVHHFQNPGAARLHRKMQMAADLF